MEYLFWPLLGVLIGLAAASRRGFSPVMAAIGGALLGPLAFLLFFASGTSRSDAGRRKCPHCQTWIDGAARVCPQCRRDVPQPAYAPPTRR